MQVIPSVRSIFTHFIGLIVTFICSSNTNVNVDFIALNISMCNVIQISTSELTIIYCLQDRLCGLVVRVSDYRYRGPGFDSRHCQIFLSSSKQSLTAVGTRCADHTTPLYPQKLALTSPTSGGRSVGIVRSLTKATEFVCYIVYRTVIIFCNKSKNTKIHNGETY